MLDRFLPFGKLRLDTTAKPNPYRLLYRLLIPLSQFPFDMVEMQELTTIEVLKGISVKVYSGVGFNVEIPVAISISLSYFGDGDLDHQALVSLNNVGIRESGVDLEQIEWVYSKLYKKFSLKHNNEFFCSSEFIIY